MKELCIFFILFGIMLLSIGVIVLFYTIRHIYKINMNHKYIKLIIIAHYLAMIFGAWIMLESINIILFATELLRTILKL